MYLYRFLGKVVRNHIINKQGDNARGVKLIKQFLAKVLSRARGSLVCSPTSPCLMRTYTLCELFLCQMCVRSDMPVQSLTKGGLVDYGYKDWHIKSQPVNFFK